MSTIHGRVAYMLTVGPAAQFMESADSVSVETEGRCADSRGVSVQSPEALVAETDSISASELIFHDEPDIPAEGAVKNIFGFS